MKRLSSQKGMTLIELMIAGILAMVVSYFIMNIMITSNRAAASSDGLAQAQETGRFVMSWLSKDARRAGYQPQMNNQDFIEPFAPICPAASAPPPADNADCTYEATDEASDRMAIRWRFDAASTISRDRQDCTGVDISAFVANEELLTDVYWVEADSGSDGDAYDDLLRCVTYRENGTIVNNTSPQTIASGVEGMQLLYQVEEDVIDEAGDTVDGRRYINADQVEALNLWDEVKAVRIFVLARAFTGQTSDTATRSYILADADPYTFANDRTSRYVLSSTVVLYSLRLQDD